MPFSSVIEAVRALEDFSAGAEVHLEAIRFLASLDECDEAKGLVMALQSEDLGVRWEAGNLLARMGQKAIPLLLKALIDPKQAGNARFRESVMHVIHSLQEPGLKNELEPLITAIRGASADTETMREANHLLRKIDPGSCSDESEVG